MLGTKCFYCILNCEIVITPLCCGSIAANVQKQNVCVLCILFALDYHLLALNLKVEATDDDPFRVTSSSPSASHI